MTDERNYIVFEVKAPSSGTEGFDFDTRAERPPTGVLNMEKLTPADAADIRQEPNKIAAEPLATRLIQPVAKTAAAKPAGGGTAWGVDAVGAGDSTFTGAGVTVAVLDTGIDAAHQAFEGMEITPANFTDETDEDIDGHGTHCAGTIAGRDIDGFRFGVAPGVDRLLAGKVLGDGGGTSEAISQGMLWAIDNGANVISMSLGIDFAGHVAKLVQAGIPVQAATSRALESYREHLRLFDMLAGLIRAKAASGKTAVIVAASGNESERRGQVPYTIAVAPPAASEGFISVAALGQKPGGGLDVADFSNTGAAVAGPGVDILSAAPGGGFAEMSGTSMATPHVAGVAALWAEAIKANGEFDPSELGARLTGNSKRVEGVAHADAGAGMVQAPVA